MTTTTTTVPSPYSGMVSVEDAVGIEAALGGAAYAGELLALRSALSEKELELLELQQAHLALASRSEETRRVQRKGMFISLSGYSHPRLPGNTSYYMRVRGAGVSVAT